MMLNPGKDFLDWSRVIECLDKYGHEGEMLGYDMINRDFDAYIKKHNIDMLVMDEDQSAFPRQFANHSKIIKFPTLAVVSEGMVCDFNEEQFFESVKVDKMSVWGDETLRRYEKFGFNDQNQIVVNGPPRLDIYHADHNKKILSKEDTCAEINAALYGDPNMGLDPDRGIITFYSYPPR